MYNDIFMYLNRKTPIAASDNTGDFDFNCPTETIINTGRSWIDGKTIYRQVYGLGSITPDSNVEVPHGIENLDNIVKIYGTIRAGWNFQYPINDILGTGGSFRVDGDNIKGYVGEHLAAIHEDAPIMNVYVILEYTTTD